MTDLGLYVFGHGHSLPNAVCHADASLEVSCQDKARVALLHLVNCREARPTGHLVLRNGPMVAEYTKHVGLNMLWQLQHPVQGTIGSMLPV